MPPAARCKRLGASSAQEGALTRDSEQNNSEKALQRPAADPEEAHSEQKVAPAQCLQRGGVQCDRIPQPIFDDNIGAALAHMIGLEIGKIFNRLNRAEINFLATIVGVEATDRILPKAKG